MATGIDFTAEGLAAPGKVGRIGKYPKVLQYGWAHTGHNLEPGPGRLAVDWDRVIDARNF